MSKRIVITGCGAVSAAGQGTGALWDALRTGQGIVRRLAGPQFDRLAIRHAAPLPESLQSELPPGVSRPAALMVLAVNEAIAQAGWEADVLTSPDTALCAATSKGDIVTMLDLAGEVMVGSNIDRPQRFVQAWSSGPGDVLCNHFQMTGPRACMVAACATGSQSLIRAAQMLRDGDASRALVVAADASVTPLMLGAFGRMGVLAADFCRPFDSQRGGFVMAEGGAAVTIELASNAVGRPLAELNGWVLGGDPSGLTAQDESGQSLARGLRILLRRADWTPESVDCYCAHGTGTLINDRVEAGAIASVFGTGSKGPRVMAAKGVIGHLLGAAGLIEPVAAIESMRRGVHLPLANLRRLDPACDVNVARSPESADLRRTICTSMGFGGQLGLLAFSRTD